MSLKVIQLGRGKNEGWYWDISVHICQNGTFKNRNQFKFQNVKHMIERVLFHKVIKRGVCMFCGEIDFRVLEDHHPFPNKDENLKITLCANCHSRLHWMLGGNRRIKD